MLRFFGFQLHKFLIEFQAHATNSGKDDQGVSIQIMEEPKDLQILKVILFDMVTNSLSNGVVINDVLLREGYAKKDLRAVFHGLLPWEHSELQCQQLKIPFVKV